MATPIRGESKTTKTRVKRGGVTGTLVKTTTNSRSSSSKPKMTYAQYAAKGGDVAAAKKYNASNTKTTESFRADAPAKMTPKKASISTPSSKPKPNLTPVRNRPVPSSGGRVYKTKSKGKLKSKVKKTVATAKDKMGASKRTAPKRTSNRKLSCRGATCKAPKRR